MVQNTNIPEGLHTFLVLFFMYTHLLWYFIQCTSIACKDIVNLFTVHSFLNLAKIVFLDLNVREASINNQPCT